MPIIASITEDKCAPHLEAIKGILNADVFEEVMGAMLREYCLNHLNHDEELYCEVFDRLATEKIISKHKFRELWRK